MLPPCAMETKATNTGMELAERVKTCHGRSTLAHTFQGFKSAKNEIGPQFKIWMGLQEGIQKCCGPPRSFSTPLWCAKNERQNLWSMGFGGRLNALR